MDAVGTWAERPVRHLGVNLGFVGSRGVFKSSRWIQEIQ